VHLPVDEALDGLAPVELFSQSPFPVLSAEESYQMIVGPHGFYWFKLEPETEVTPSGAHRRSGLELADAGPDGFELPVLQVAEGLQNLLVPTMAQYTGPEALEDLLPSFIADQRWFGSKGHDLQRVAVEDAVRLRRDPTVYLSILEVEMEDETAFYTLPLTVTTDADDSKQILHDHPAACIAWLDVEGGGSGLLHDATVTADFWSVLFEWWKKGSKGRSLKGVYVATPSDGARQASPESVTLLTGEQSNTSAIVNDAYFVKLYRRLERGTNPRWSTHSPRACTARSTSGGATASTRSASCRKHSPSTRTDGATPSTSPAACSTASKTSSFPRMPPRPRTTAPTARPARRASRSGWTTSPTR
jgi:maltose alpha-D-glucosyltransferase/alpha-amylase